MRRFLCRFLSQFLRRVVTKPRTVATFTTVLMAQALMPAGAGEQPSVQASVVTVAVASNFSAPMKVIATEFEQATGHKVTSSFGGTGSFYAQIKNGAPFDLFLSADAQTPARLVQEGVAVADSRFTYAVGRLVLWSTTPGLVDGTGAILGSAAIDRIAIADPKLAPYGAAAQQVIERLGLMQALRPKLVQGKNISQTYQFVASGNAQLGFVALSQVFVNGELKAGSGWVVPSDDHTPISQDAVLLIAGQGNPAAHAFLAYLQSDKARKVIESYGYQY